MPKCGSNRSDLPWRECKPLPILSRFREPLSPSVLHTFSPSATSNAPNSDFARGLAGLFSLWRSFRLTGTRPESKRKEEEGRGGVRRGKIAWIPEPNPIGNRIVTSDCEKPNQIEVFRPAAPCEMRPWITPLIFSTKTVIVNETRNSIADYLLSV
jgi:hypothetical protein